MLPNTVCVLCVYPCSDTLLNSSWALCLFEVMGNRRTHVIIPDQLVTEIDKLVGKRSRSQFLVQAATFELKRQRQVAAVKAATGAWKIADHPELKGSSVAYQRKLRAESDHRLNKQAARDPLP